MNPEQSSSIGSVPPRPTLYEALTRYWAVVLLPTVALLAGALALGFSREPTYTAEAQLNVGQADITTQAIPGFTQAAESLANAYSRLMSSNVIAEPVGRRLRLSPATVSDRVSGAPVSESTIFRVEATGPSERAAVTLATASTAEIQRYVQRLGTTGSEAQRLLDQYRDASREAQQLTREASGARQDDAGSAEAQSLGVRAATARLRQETIAQRYQEARPAAAGTTVQILDGATSATNDRTAVLQRFAFVGFFGGLLIGIALAVLLANRSWRRSIRSY